MKALPVSSVGISVELSGSLDRSSTAALAEGAAFTGAGMDNCIFPVITEASSVAVVSDEAACLESLLEFVWRVLALLSVLLTVLLLPADSAGLTSSGIVSSPFALAWRTAAADACSVEIPVCEPAADNPVTPVSALPCSALPCFRSRTLLLPGDEAAVDAFPAASADPNAVEARVASFAPGASPVAPSRPVPREASIACQLERKLGVADPEEDEELAAAALVNPALASLLCPLA
jgi:hypothetical protein